MRAHFPLNTNGQEDSALLPWSDGVPSTGTAGSYPGHALFTDTEAEILAALDAAGLARSGSDLTQLGQAISRGVFLGIAAGSPNAIAAALPGSAAFPALLPGMRFSLVIAAANTGAVTLTLTGFGAAPGTLQLRRRDGGALQAGDLALGTIVDVRFDDTVFRLLGTTPSEIISYLSSGSGQTTIVNLIQNNYAKGSLISRQNFGAPDTYTYTPSSAQVRLIRMTVIGGGGGGGGTAATDGTSFGAGGGGGGGGTAITDLLLSTNGVSGAAIIVGSGGSGVNTNVGGTNLGGTGSSSSFGPFVSATGGGGGGHAAAGITFAQLQVGGTKGSGLGGNVLNISGQTGYQGTTQNSTNFVSGAGGTSYFGGGGVPRFPDSPGAGNNSDTVGSGGGGAAISINTPSQPGGSGAAGVVLIEEYA